MCAPVVGVCAHTCVHKCVCKCSSICCLCVHAYIESLAPFLVPGSHPSSSQGTPPGHTLLLGGTSTLGLGTEDEEEDWARSKRFYVQKLDLRISRVPLVPQAEKAKAEP